MLVTRATQMMHSIRAIGQWIHSVAYSCMRTCASRNSFEIALIFNLSESVCIRYPAWFNDFSSLLEGNQRTNSKHSIEIRSPQIPIHQHIRRSHGQPEKNGPSTSHNLWFFIRRLPHQLLRRPHESEEEKNGKHSIQHLSFDTTCYMRLTF